jgi:hypothetical protein
VLLANLLADFPPEAAQMAARRLRLPDLRRVSTTLRGLAILTHPEALRYPLAESEAALLMAEDPGGWIALYRAVQRAGNRPAIDMNRFIRKCRITPRWINGIWLEKNGYPGGPGRREILLRVREASLSGKVRGSVDAARLAESMRCSRGAGARTPGDGSIHG